MTTIRYSASKILRGTDSRATNTFLIQEEPLGGSVVASSVTLKDVVYARTVATAADPNFKLIVDPAHPKAGFESLTPAVCSASQDGHVRKIGSGICTVLTSASPNIRSYSRDMASTAVTADVPTGFAAGSLASHIDAAIRAMASGKSPGASTQAVLTSSSGGHTNPNIVRNASIWTGALDLSAISVYTSAFGSNIFPVVLISPWHIMAGHVGCSPGQSVVFKRPDGAYEIRTVVSQLQLPDARSTNFVGILSAAISTITPMKLIPADWQAKLPHLAQPTSQFATDTRSRLHVLNKGYAAGDWIRALNVISIDTLIAPAYMKLQKSTDVTLGPWSSDVIGGDSNGPVFVPINGVPVLCHCMNFVNGGQFYGGNTLDIQAKMNTLGQAQSLTFPNLSGFTSF